MGHPITRRNMRHFCTYFDHNYLSMGLALYRSLRRHSPEFTLWVLCLSDACFEILSRLSLPGVRLVQLADLERGDPDLLRAKQNRSRVEYYFTCTPSWPRYLLNHYPEIQLITYLDADLYFFGDPEEIFSEIGERSIAIIGHRFASWNRHLEAAGVFNVGWITFRNDANGRECLEWWRDRCIECCTYDLDAGKVGDQKYLDDWPTRFRGVAVLRHKGANVAPWNVGSSTFSSQDGLVYADDEPIIFFHFHGLKRIAGIVYDSGLTRYRSRLPRVLRRRLFAPYVKELFLIAQEVSPLIAELAPNDDPLSGLRSSGRPMLGRLFTAIPRAAGIARRLLSGNYVLISKGRMI